MASVVDGTIPRSKIKEYAQDELGLVGDEVDFFISVMRRVERKQQTGTKPDPEQPDQPPAATQAVKGIVNRLAPTDDKSFRTKKPKVRYPRQ